MTVRRKGQVQLCIICIEMKWHIMLPSYITQSTRINMNTLTGPKQSPLVLHSTDPSLKIHFHLQKQTAYAPEGMTGTK